ncbi:MAG: hypothetical protein ACW99G_17335 [Candidatus Thorarchaeota archaeon]|jgi:hypothetical protein
MKEKIKFRNTEGVLEGELKRKRAQREVREGPKWPKFPEKPPQESEWRDIFNQIKEYIDHGDKKV